MKFLRYKATDGTQDGWVYTHDIISIDPFPTGAVLVVRDPSGSTPRYSSETPNVLIDRLARLLEE
jgi:hypothetical protein